MESVMPIDLILTDWQSSFKATAVASWCQQLQHRPSIIEVLHFFIFYNHACPFNIPCSSGSTDEFRRRKTPL